MGAKIPESVLVVVHTDDLQVLLLERADHPGYWQSVTGSRGRLDEPFAQTCRLEVLEDTPPPVPEEEPVMPDHLLRLLPEEIAEDLALSPSDGVARLNEKRRLFAKFNHPDGVHEDFRDNATIRMTIANLMIDEALRRLDA